ncbi:unnamed protein product [Urochloa decumbens]|uniref:Uncharacterized protein n=1 Tax=Urochloa decumbens TaxID=240449 RepID=A0ABC9GSR5_9POAL
MLTINRSVDDFTRSLDEQQRRVGHCVTRSIEKRRTSKPGREIGYILTAPERKQKTSGEATGSLTPGCIVDHLLGGSSGFDQDTHDLLSEEVLIKISKCVVSLFLFDGRINVLVCSGIPIESKKSSITRILTTEKFGATYLTRRDAGRYMRIQVRDASNNVATGFLEENYLSRGITLVNVKQSLDVRAIHLNDEVEVLPGSNLVGIELVGSGEQMPRRGIMTKDSCTSEDGTELSYSTCNMSKDGDGGPLFDGDGNFVGMNLVLDDKRGPFMQRSVIIGKLKQFENAIQLLVSKMYRVRRIRRPLFELLHGKELTNQEEDLDSSGYPKPSIAADDCNVVLVNSFEDTFGDKYDSGKGVWGVFSETISEELSQSVVSLASYNGDTRFFACSGLIIKWNGCTTILTSASLVRNRCDESKIQENLRIDVLLPDQQHTEGTLQHCHLHYNVAIVSFKGSTFVAADIYGPMIYKYSEVVAVGRVFKSGVLMATRGALTRGHTERRFDCTNLFYSSCEITKAGIGGPLVDFDGKFVGMNFYYAKEGTPFLKRCSILEVLAHFEKKRSVAEADDDGYVNRWPVPKPFWRCPDKHHQNEDKEGHR